MAARFHTLTIARFSAFRVPAGRLLKPRRRPVRPRQPGVLRRATAVCASFAVSGVMHELFIFYLRGRVSGYWAAFFSVQGPLVVAEAGGRQWMKRRGLRIPRWLAVPLTLGTLLALGDLLFFPGEWSC